MSPQIENLESTNITSLPSSIFLKMFLTVNSLSLVVGIMYGTRWCFKFLLCVTSISLSKLAYL